MDEIGKSSDYGDLKKIVSAMIEKKADIAELAIEIGGKVISVDIRITDIEKKKSVIQQASGLPFN